MILWKIAEKPSLTVLAFSPLPKVILWLRLEAWGANHYVNFSGQYFPVSSPSAGKYGPEKTPYLKTFHAVNKLLDNLALLMLEATTTGVL